jgi:hypothetical protein
MAIQEDQLLRRSLLASGVLAVAAVPAVARGVAEAPPPRRFKKVSTLVKLPSFLPGLGTLYVDPKTLPDGPFLAYDHRGRLVSTIYMIPLKDLDAHSNIPDLPAPGGLVDHVSLYFNAGHPGVPEPHYHIILWHIPRSEERLVAK